MIVYENTKSGFIEDVVNGVIDTKIDRLILERMGRHTGLSEIRSWQNSLGRMGLVLSDEGIPGDAGIAIEYCIPYTPKRVDMIVSGRDEFSNSTAVVIELKQWSEVEKVEGMDGIVRTAISRGMRSVAHPSYQVWSYAMMISDYNSTVQDESIGLSPCTYLHNYDTRENDPLLDPIYSEYIELAPVFTKKDASKLRDFIKKFVKYGDGGETIFKIDGGRLRPSKSLQDSLVSMIEGNPEFNMIDDQKVAFETVMNASRRIATSGKKETVIVKGGPGTGKSVLAVNLLVRMTENGLVSSYVTKNSAPRNVYSSKLKGHMKKTNIDNLFKGSGSFTDTEKNVFDALIVDEAHRLNEKSGLFGNLGENQVKELIRASKLSVFFIDEDQRVVLKDIGTEGEIRKWAKEEGSRVTVLELETQFRCNGSDGYISWLDDLLQIRETANFDWVDNLEYDIRVLDDPNDVRNMIRMRNAANNRSRLVAGYCWNWITESKNDPDVHDITIPEYGFEMSWNLGNTGTWAIDPDSVEEAGCIHTCQGLEFDYVGVIIGNDMRYENGAVITDYTKRAKTDSSLRGLKKKYPDPEEAERVADRIIRNTYRTLMTRGMKGCFVFCTDRNLNEHLKKRVEKFRKR
jgi:DUF2075 family protein